MVRRTVLRARGRVVGLVVSALLVGGLLPLAAVPAAAATTALVADPAVAQAVGAGFDGNVRVLVPTGDGGYLAGGDFTTYRGEPAPRLARLDADLDLDADFAAAIGSGFDATVFSVATTADGGYLVGGDFTAYQGQTVRLLVRLDADLVLDADFTATMGAGFSGTVFSAEPTDDGGYLVGGLFTHYQGVLTPHVARLNPDLSLDLAFTAALGAGFDDLVASVTQTDDGGYLVTGRFQAYQGSPAPHAARLDAGLGLDTDFAAALGSGFGPAGATVFALQPAGDGGYLAAGSFTTYQGQDAASLARLGADLTRDSAFTEALGTGFGSFVYDVVPLAGGRYDAAGAFTTYRGQTAGRLARLQPLTVQVVVPADQTGIAGYAVDPVQVGVQAEPDLGTAQYAATGLPDGLTLDAATGVVSGTPTTVATSTVTVSVTVADVTDTATFVWDVSAPVAPALSGEPPAGVTGQPYDFTFTLTGAPAPVLTVTGGSLPDGITVDASGRLSGTPLTSGTFPVELTASNGTAPDAVRTVSITVVSRAEIVAQLAERSAGQQQRVTGTGFVPGEQVVVTLDPGALDVGTAVADATGRVALSFDVPAQSAPGVHTVTATARSGTATTTFRVVAAGAVSPGGDRGADDVLAATGADPTGWALLGLAFAAAGTVLLVLRRSAGRGTTPR